MRTFLSLTDYESIYRWRFGSMDRPGWCVSFCYGCRSGFSGVSSGGVAHRKVLCFFGLGVPGPFDEIPAGSKLHGGMIRPPLGYVNLRPGTPIKWGDLWFRPYDGVWVEVGEAFRGCRVSYPSTVCARKIENKVDKSPPVSETSTMTKLYNIGAHGIPDRFLFQVRSWNLDLFWSAHALTEAVDLVKNLGIPQSAFPKSVTFGTHPLNDWEVVELEASVNGSVTKVVARRPIRGTKWSLVLVINVDGVVRTCWANLTSDTHRTLDISKYSKA